MRPSRPSIENIDCDQTHIWQGVQAGQWLTAAQARVWQRPFRSHERSVDVYVKRLRRKLKEALPGSELIHTHYGFGYRLSPSVSQLFHTAATDR